jgi:outer membrane protein assembly factor BamB
MKKIASIAFLLTVLSAPAFARRAPPKEPMPVTYKGVTYSAPYSHEGWDQVGGYVVATDAKTGKQLWDLKIYQLNYDKTLEGDVQHIFITSLKISSGRLLVKNEKGGQYTIDLNKKAVISGEPLVYGVKTK